MTERSVYVEKLHAQLEAWDAELQKMQAEANKISDDARAQYDKHLEALHEQQAKIRSYLEDMRKSSEDSWTDFMHRSEAAWKDMAEGIQKAWGHFR